MSILFKNGKFERIIDYGPWSTIMITYQSIPLGGLRRFSITNFGLKYFDLIWLN